VIGEKQQGERLLTEKNDQPVRQPAHHSQQSRHQLSEGEHAGHSQQNGQQPSGNAYVAQAEPNDPSAAKQNQQTEPSQATNNSSTDRGSSKSAHHSKYDEEAKLAQRDIPYEKTSALEPRQQWFKEQFDRCSDIAFHNLTLHA